jgi:hypothetical protein
MLMAKVISTGLGGHMLNGGQYMLAELSLKTILGRLNEEQRADLSHWAVSAGNWGRKLADFISKFPFLVSTESNTSPVLSNSWLRHVKCVQIIGRKIGWHEPSSEIPDSLVRLSIMNDPSGRVIDVHGPTLYLSWPYFRDVVFNDPTNASTKTLVLPECFPSSLLLFLIKLIHGCPRNYFVLTWHELSFVLLNGLNYGLINERGEPVAPFIDLVGHAKSQLPDMTASP